ncbi:hypothetical protein PUN4_930005 [Paraburkholderia unamae]|nr:hypothetical protein PUN4_930005 [Paraburkholderia unamae]
MATAPGGNVISGARRWVAYGAQHENKQMSHIMAAPFRPFYRNCLKTLPTLLSTGCGGQARRRMRHYMASRR